MCFFSADTAGDSGEHHNPLQDRQMSVFCRRLSVESMLALFYRLLAYNKYGMHTLPKTKHGMQLTGHEREGTRTVLAASQTFFFFLVGRRNAISSNAQLNTREVWEACPAPRGSILLTDRLCFVCWAAMKKCDSTSSSGESGRA